MSNGFLRHSFTSHSHTESQDWLIQGLSHTLNSAYNLLHVQSLTSVSTQDVANFQTQSIKYQSTYRVTTNLHIQDYDRKQTMVQPHTLSQIATPYTFHKVTSTYVSQNYNRCFRCFVSNSREEGEWEMRNDRWSYRFTLTTANFKHNVNAHNLWTSLTLLPASSQPSHNQISTKNTKNAQPNKLTHTPPTLRTKCHAYRLAPPYIYYRTKLNSLKHLVRTTVAESHK